ncbi:hypothetical protein BU17DRAFT_63419 [Hysterangium stoloniferum]|nr:hypothetical protein BU17DRAFT_63419 [Hysterangium stoloniferum]
MSMINVPVLGSPDTLRRQLRAGVVSAIPHSPERSNLARGVPQTMRPKRSSVHNPPQVVGAGHNERRPEPRNMYRHRDPTPHPHRHSPVVRDFAYPDTVHAKPSRRTEDLIAHVGNRNASRQTAGNDHPRSSRDYPIVDDNKTGGTSSGPLNRRLGLRRTSRNPIPAPIPISFDYHRTNDNNNDINNNREPAPIPPLPRSAIRQKVAQLRFRRAQESNQHPNPQPNIPIITPDPDPDPPPNSNNDLPDLPTLRRGFFAFPDKSRYFNFMRKNNTIPAADSAIDSQSSKRVRFKSISSRIGGDAWRKSKGRSQTPGPAGRRERPNGSLMPAPSSPAPVPHRVPKSRIPSEARRGRVFGANDVPNIDIQPPTPPLSSTGAPPIGEPRRKGYGRMSIRMPSVRVPKVPKLGFPKWRTAGAGVDVGGGEGDGLANRGAAAVDGDGTLMQDRPRSIRQGRAPSLLQDHRQSSPPSRHDRTSSLVQDRPASVKERAPSIRQRATSLQSNRPPSIRQQPAPSSGSIRSPSVRPRATSLQSYQQPSVHQPAPSLQSNRPPSTRQPAPSLHSHHPPSIRHPPSLQSNQPPPLSRQHPVPLQSHRPPSIRPRIMSLQSDQPPSIRNRQGPGQTPSATMRHSRAPSPAPAPAPAPRPSTALSNRDPAARLSLSRSIVLTTAKTKRGGHLTTLQLPLRMWSRNKWRKPEILVWRKKRGVLEPVDVGGGGVAPEQLEALRLVQTSSRDRDRLTPSPVFIQQPHTRTRALRRSTRLLLHPLLLTPTLLRPARLHWDVRDPRLTQRVVAERILKEPFIALTATSTAMHDSLSLSIPIPRHAASASFLPFASLTSLTNITSKKRANKYWTVTLPAFSSSSSSSSLIPPTVLQILGIISTALRVRATPHELAALYDKRNARYRREVEEVFRKRCRREDGEREREKIGTGTGAGTGGRARNKGGGGRQERVGIRRVDLLGRKTRWLGLERGRDVEGWVVKLGNMNMQ